ncbi:aldehyde dehydrogenase family protein, partial [Salmonella enterica]|uniref:aldehyde dehydrogenase family protein n=1 Tax=Salmonella enterica TaxID=28901 RepID=UPI0032B385DB
MQTLKDKDLFRQAGIIGGNWCAAASGKVIEVTNPATGLSIGTVPNMGRADTKAAIEAAEAAYPLWKAKTHAERAALIEKWYAL